MNPIILNTEKRETYGKKLRSLRKKGILPIHVYGPGMESIALQSDTISVLKVLQEAGRTNPVKIVDSEKEHTTLVRNVDQHPATGELQHVDFMRVDENKAIEVEVPVVLIGEAPGTRGGSYDYHMEPFWLTDNYGRDALIGFLLDGYPIYGPEENGLDLISSDLDEFHGHFHENQDFPNGIYHYHITADAPYLNGLGYYGLPGTVTQ